jgi:ABC-2 type transport system permease protein
MAKGYQPIFGDWRVIKKYWRIYQSLFRTGLIAEMEFRANLLIRFVADIIWYFAQILTFEVIYKHTPMVGTWNIQQTRVFLGMIFVVDAIYMIFLSENLDHLTEKVRKGELDLLLAKPVNSQFMVSLQRVLVTQTSCLIVSLIWFIYAIYQLPEFEFSRLLWLIVLIPCGLISIYSVRFMISTISVIVTRGENLQYIWYTMYKMGLRPDAIYSRWLRYLIMSLIPVAFVASVPSHLILEPPNFALVAWVILWSAFLLWTSHRFWQFALRRYQSASS